jgi:hypothetical protein
MTLHRRTRRLTRAVLALSAIACIALAIAGAATARPIDAPSTVPNSSRPTVVRETVVQPDGGGPDAIAYVAIGAGAAVVILAAGLLGARVATRTTPTRPTDVHVR